MELFQRLLNSHRNCLETQIFLRFFLTERTDVYKTAKLTQLVLGPQIKTHLCTSQFFSAKSQKLLSITGFHWTMRPHLAASCHKDTQQKRNKSCVPTCCNWLDKPIYFPSSCQRWVQLLQNIAACVLLLTIKIGRSIKITKQCCLWNDSVQKVERTVCADNTKVQWTPRNDFCNARKQARFEPFSCVTYRVLFLPCRRNTHPQRKESNNCVHAYLQEKPCIWAFTVPDSDTSNCSRSSFSGVSAVQGSMSSDSCVSSEKLSCFKWKRCWQNGNSGPGGQS